MSQHNPLPFQIKGQKDLNNSLFCIDGGCNILLNDNASIIMKDELGKKWKISINSDGVLNTEPIERIDRIKHNLNKVLGKENE